ncbi:MAG: hypothetical protein OXN86_00340 [Chloroflexota bacterium]|nr:hypothetical protein [Chloroflexota bacterium]
MTNEPSSRAPVAKLEERNVVRAAAAVNRNSEGQWRQRQHSELFAPAVRDWPGVPRHAHLLIDQTRVGPDELRGELLGRIAQLALMAAYRASWSVMQRLVPLLAELVQVGGTDELRLPQT